MIQYLKHIILGLICTSIMGCMPKKKQKDDLQKQIYEGEVLFQNSGCVQCHSLKGEAMYGPALDSILNTSITVHRKGKEETLIIDSTYIYRAIKYPDYEKVKEYDSKKMPIPTLTDQQIERLTAYIIFINKGLNLKEK